MSRFLAAGPLTIAAWARDDGTPIWITSAPFAFQLGDETRPVFEVPAGFETDLGSIPAWLRAIWNSGNPRCARAYVLHDWVNKLTAGQPPGAPASGRRSSPRPSSTKSWRSIASHHGAARPSSSAYVGPPLVRRPLVNFTRLGERVNRFQVYFPFGDTNGPSGTVLTRQSSLP